MDAFKGPTSDGRGKERERAAKGREKNERRGEEMEWEERASHTVAALSLARRLCHYPI